MTRRRRRRNQQTAASGRAGRRAEARKGRQKSKYAAVQPGLPRHGFFTNRARLIWLAHRGNPGAVQAAIRTDWKHLGTTGGGE